MLVEINPEIYQKTTFAYNSILCKCIPDLKCGHIHRPIVVTHDNSKDIAHWFY